MDPTPVFFVYFGGLVLYTTTLLVTSLVVVSVHGKGNKAVYWALFVSEKITSASPLTLGFISIDRLLVIWLNARYVRRLQRVIAATAILLSVVLMIVDSVIDYDLELQEGEEHEDSGHSNDVENTAVSLPLFDALVSCSGFIFSVALLFLMRRLLLRNKLFKATHLTLNHRLAALDVVLHLFFDVIPVMVGVFWECLDDEELSETIGPYRTLTSSANFMLCLGVQCYVIRRVTAVRKPKPAAMFCQRILINKTIVNALVC